MSISVFYAVELAVETVLGWCSWLFGWDRQDKPDADTD